MLEALVLLLATTSPGEARCLSGMTQATSQLKAADVARGRKNFVAANQALDAGLHVLGDRYAPPTTNDDTGMHLVLAESQQRKGKLRLAVDLKRRVLVERLQLCRQRDR